MEKEIVIMISENPKFTMVEVADKLNVTKRTIERIVKNLRESVIFWGEAAEIRRVYDCEWTDGKI